MPGTRVNLLLASLLLAVVALGWTRAGETSNPLLPANALPRDILGECGPAACSAEHEFRAHWVGRTASGNLFVVSRSVCEPGHCSNWLVEQGEGRARTLLELPGTFRFHRLSGRYPVVELQLRKLDDSVLRVRFEWDGREYARTQAQPIFEVAGIECGTREECHASAQRAYQAQELDRALRIWQQVHGVSWI
jgi:hypothetical protein